MLRNKDYKQIYLSHISTIVNDFFRKDQYIERVRELQKLISEAFKEDENRYYSVEDFNNSLDQTIGKRSRIPGLKELMTPRTEYLKKKVVLAVVPPKSAK